MLHHFTLTVDHQGEPHIKLLALVMASQITQCGMMNIFYSTSATAEGCDIYNLCTVLNDTPQTHNSNATMATCTFSCTCAMEAIYCEICAYTFHGVQDTDWQLCEIIIEV